MLDPVQDFLFIIAAPLLCLGLAVFTLRHFGLVKGASVIIVAHIVLTVAHHMPTFIRIYGDLDLLERFRWNILLAPVVPVCFALVMLGYINYHQYPVEYFLYLYIFLTLWDPWHFLRQHFGFMRIYDRHNQAPRALASNLDWAICVVWFIHIMVASADWIPGLLEDLYRTANIPAILFFSSTKIDLVQQLTWWLAALGTAVYGLYIAWCIQQRFFVSIAKLALLLGTFAVMYLTYVPNEWIVQLVPAWSFKVGFATVGIVHMTQYLAIVWRYDAQLTRQNRARKGWFSWLHSRKSRQGIALAAACYVAICVGYGDLVTSTFENRWLMSALLAIGFTSTLLHYYYDGFIWKIRHVQNQRALGLAASEVPGGQKPGVAEEAVRPGHSRALGDLGDFADVGAPAPKAGKQIIRAVVGLWQNLAGTSPGRILARQLIYFAVPMGILTWGALGVWHSDTASYIQRMYQAQAFSEQGRTQQANESAQLAFASMQRELPIAEKIAELKPTSANEAALAFLVYNESLYNNIVIPALAGKNSTAHQRRDHVQKALRAADLLTAAVYRGGELAHPGREQLSRDLALEIAASWQRQ